MWQRRISQFPIFQHNPRAYFPSTAAAAVAYVMSHFLITLDFDFRILSLHLHLFFLLLLDQLQPLRGDQQYRSLTEPPNTALTATQLPHPSTLTVVTTPSPALIARILPSQHVFPYPPISFLPSSFASFAWPTI